MTASIAERAPAKLNLALEIIGRRPDGYHELATVFQTISLYDELRFEPAASLALVCDDATLDGPSNLVLRAANALRDHLGRHDGARIALRKRIPVAAGLGGGSADAAAALRGLLRLWQVRLPPPELARLAAGLGADVPFLLTGGTALARGVGDLLAPLPDPPRRWAICHTPHAAGPDKTARAYRALAPAAWSAGRVVEQIAASLADGRWPDLADAPNSFESVADDLYPDLPAARERFRAAGAPWVKLAGAGPTIFTFVGTLRQAEQIAGALPDAIVAATVDRLPSVDYPL